MSARGVLVLLLAAGAQAVTLNCGDLVGGLGAVVSIDDVIFTDEEVCENTCGSCSSGNGFKICAPTTKLNEFRCAEPDASSLISMAIVMTPTVEVDCEAVATLKFESGCPTACSACSTPSSPKTCIRNVCEDFEIPDIAVDPIDRTSLSKDLPGSLDSENFLPKMKTITFGA